MTVCRRLWKLMNQNTYTRACRDHLWIWDPNFLCFLEGEWEVRSPAVYWKPHGYSSKLWPVTEGVQKDSWPNTAGSYALLPTWILLLACFGGPQPCPALLQLISILLGHGEGELTSTHETAMDRTLQIVSSCWTLRGNWFPFLCLHILLCQNGLWYQQCKFVQECLPYQYWVLTFSLYCLDTADSAMCFTKQNKRLQRIALRELRGDIPNTNSRAGDILFFLCGWG